MKASRIGWIAALAALAIVVIAWIDGGEEPLHEISEPVVLTGAQG